MAENMTKKGFFSALARRIGFVLFAASVFLILPATCFVDIENLYAEGYSRSVATTNPSNAHGRRDGNTADSDREHWGDDVENRTFPMSIRGKMPLTGLTRMGVSPLLLTSLALTRTTLSHRWSLAITIAVIVSVLVYMELLVRRHRILKTRPPRQRRGRWGSFSRQRV